MASDQHCPYVLPEDLRGDHVKPTEWHCCKPPLDRSVEGGQLCIFHNPKKSKDVQEFSTEVQSKCDANYRGFVFPVGFDTRLLHLGKADFTGARFMDHADFSDATFEGSTHFDGVNFDKSVDFRGTSFCGNVSFAQAVFCESATFERASFLKLDLGTATSDEKFDAGFLGRAANFARAKFKGFANFRYSEFKVTVNFEYVEFADKVTFGRSEFFETATIRFSDASFCKESYFHNICSGAQVTFSDCEFREETNFSNAVFRAPLRFFRSTFRSLARFEDEPPKTDKKPRLNVRFHEVDMERIAFRRADLRNASFYHCYNLDKAEFSACLWNQAFGRQRLLYDELALRGSQPAWGTENDEAITNSPPVDHEWERVENTYRDLRRNFEDRKDYAGASEFYVGEMEMRRLAKPRVVSGILSLEALYLHLSTYGENWWKPLLYLFGLLVISTLVYAGWPSNSTMLGLSLLHSLSVLTLLRVSVAEPLHWTGQIMAIMQLVLSPILITLSLLAIRRKLRR